MDLSNKRWMCWVDPTSWVKGRGHRVSIIVENESGHFPTGDPKKGVEPWYWGDPRDCAHSLQEAEETCREYNQRRGITPKIEKEIMISSMHLTGNCTVQN